MATTAAIFGRGTFPTTTGNLYAGAATTNTYIVTNIVITNTTSAQITATITLDSVVLINALPIAGNGSIFIDCKQPVSQTGTAKPITGVASASGLTYHISGVIVA